MSFIGARCKGCTAAAPVLYTLAAKKKRLVLCAACFERKAGRPCPGPEADNAVRTTHAVTGDDCDEFRDVADPLPAVSTPGGEGAVGSCANNKSASVDEWVVSEKQRRAAERSKPLGFWSEGLAEAFSAGACPRLVLRQQRYVPHTVVPQLTLAEVVAAYVPISRLVLDARFEGLPACTSLTCRGPIAAALRHRLFPAHLLKHIDVTWCTELTDAFMAALPVLCPRLETVRSLHCPMTSIGLRALAACERLRVVRVRDTGAVDNFSAPIVFGVPWPALEVFDSSRLPLSRCNTPQRLTAPNLTTLVLNGYDVGRCERFPVAFFDLPSLTSIDAPIPESIHDNNFIRSLGVPRAVQSWAGLALPGGPTAMNMCYTPMDMFGFFVPAPMAIRQLTRDADVADQFPLLVEAERTGELPRSFIRGTEAERDFEPFDLSNVSADVVRRRAAEVETLAALLEQTDATDVRFWPWPKLTQLKTVVFPPLPSAVLSQLTVIEAHLSQEDIAVILRHCGALETLRSISGVLAGITTASADIALSLLGPDRSSVVARALLLVLPRALACLVALRRRARGADSSRSKTTGYSLAAPPPRPSFVSKDTNGSNDGSSKRAPNKAGNDGGSAMILDQAFLSGLDVEEVCGGWLSDFYATVARRTLLLSAADDRFDGPLFPGAPAVDPADYAAFCRMCQIEADHVVAAAPGDSVQDLLLAAVTTDRASPSGNSGAGTAAVLFTAEAWPPGCDGVESRLDRMPDLRSFGFDPSKCDTLPSLLAVGVAHGGGHVEITSSSRAAAAELQLWSVVAAVWILLGDSFGHGVRSEISPTLPSTIASDRRTPGGAGGGAGTQGRRPLPPAAGSVWIDHVGGIDGRAEAAAFLEKLVRV